MNKLSDIAKDYLADFDVLTEARKEFEKELADWWVVLTSKHLTAALTKMNKGQIDKHDDNKNSPGEGYYRVVENQEFFLWLSDPRCSEQGCYRVGLYFCSQKALKKLKEQEAFVERFNKLARELEIGGSTGLKWTDTEYAELALEDIKIIPDDPDETMRMVCDVASRHFRLVVEHHRWISKGRKR